MRQAILNKQKLEDEISLRKKEKAHLARQTTVNINVCKKILKYFINEWEMEIAISVNIL